jgi:ABC-type transport system involved in multi-copper enzyme maturation permease subunit
MYDVVIGNPIIQREVFSLVKSKKALGIQIVLALVFVMLIVIRWPTDAQVDLSNAQSVQVFRVFGYGLLVALLLFVPAFPAVSLVKEKNKGTLALLFNSPMSPLAIYVGKFLGVFAFVLLLIFLSVPAVAACYAMGGIDLGKHVGMLYAVLVLMVAQYTALGLLISSRSGSGDSSMRVTYFAVAMISSITLIPHLLFQGEGSTTALIADWMRCLSPFAAVMEIMGHGSVGAQGRLEVETVAWRFMFLSVIVTLGFAVATITQLNYRIFDRSRSQGKITDEQSRGVKAFRGVFFLIDPQRRKAGIRLINPVFVKEFRTRRFGRIHWILRLVALCAVVSVALTGLTAMQSQAWGPEIIGGIMALLQILLILLLIPSTSSGLISAERESGGWTLLQMTPMSTFKIVNGKLMSSFVTIVAILAGTLPGYLVLMWIQPALSYQIGRVLISLLFAAVFAVCLSSFVSSLFRRTAPATATAYGILIGVFIGTLLIWMGRDAPFGYNVVQSALVLNPLAAALAEMEVSGFETYDLIPNSWWISGVLSVLCLVGLAIQVTRINRPS